MEKESLMRVREEIIKLLRTLDIDNIDKVELMINLDYFLDADVYEESIKVLNKNKKW